MALKLELEQWQHACEAFDNKDYDSALRIFYNMADNAKMHFNIGLILATLEDHERAIAAYRTAIAMDQFFAVAYFQMGVSHFILNDMEAARQDFDQAFQKLRGNEIINYQQLGLSFRLYSCETLFNRGICQLYLGRIDAGLTDLYHAQKSKMTEEHDIIDQAVRDRGRGYSVYSIPPGVLYRPPEARLRQLRGVDVFAAADKLNIPKPMGGGIKRNNSILLPQPHPHHQQQPRRPRASSRPGTPSTPYEYRHRPSVSQQQQQSPTEQRRRKDSNVTVYTGIEEWTDASNSSTSSFSSSLRYRSDGRRVDSGFESAQEDRYSTASTSTTGRNSTRSHKTSRYSPPPVPPIPKSQSGYDDFDPMTYGQFDNEYDQVFDSLQNMTIQEQRIRQRLNSNNEIIPQPSTSSSSCKDMTNKIRIKAHFSDTRILVVPNNITFEDLLSRIKSKFNAPDTLRLQYKDEDDEMVLMIDEDDLHMARQISRARNGDSLSSGEKMEIWCLA